MSVFSDKIFQYYCWDKNIGVSINGDLVKHIEFKTVYAEDFDYVDGEEGNKVIKNLLSEIFNNILNKL